MKLPALLILFPLVPAALLALFSNRAIRSGAVKFGVLIIAGLAVYSAGAFSGPIPRYFEADSPLLDKAVFGGEVLIGLYLLYACRQVKFREVWIPVLVVLQAALLFYVEFGCAIPEVASPLYVDNLSIVMALIIGLVGGLVCVYALSYMRDYHAHHPEIADRRKSFFFLLFLFLSSMFGIVFSNNLLWLHFFWEVTTVCCFLLIGYSRTPEAVRNAFRALGLNLVGGLGFSLAILYLVRFAPQPTLDLSRVIILGSTASLSLLPVLLLCLAGLTKSAQMPFSSWLLGAMVAPTPVSALLHSSTMVKAGVFLVLKFAPALQGSLAGHFIALIGGSTFLAASLIAVTRSNAKQVLAYSTIANLGLVIACAGIGTPVAVLAAFLLIIFHAVSKGLLFMAVGTIEHRVGSRDIEDMGGLISSSAPLALTVMIGILGMFLAPFGMLIGKWTCLKAFMDSSPVLAVLLAFGSAPTLFFWSKWLGKVMSVPNVQPAEIGPVSSEEWTALGALAALTVGACGLFPAVSTYWIRPYLEGVNGRILFLDFANAAILALILGLLVLVAIGFLFYPRKSKIVGIYLGGANLANGSFQGALGRVREANMRNYYLSGFLSERKIMTAGIVASQLLMAAALLAVAL